MKTTLAILTLIISINVFAEELTSSSEIATNGSAICDAASRFKAKESDSINPTFDQPRLGGGLRVGSAR